MRAWRGLDSFEGRGSLRSWLYTVATRTCLDIIRGRGRRALPIDLGPSSERAVIDNVPRTDVDWLGPYPDSGLPAGSASPDARYEHREAVELAFVAALQHLPGNQRAALLLFDVLGFSAAEIAAVMETTTASVNSALQRARQLVVERIPSPSQQQTLRTLEDGRLRELVGGYAAALEDGDIDALVALLAEDVTWSMPPIPHWYRGLHAVIDFATRIPLDRLRLVAAPAHDRQRPAGRCQLPVGRRRRRPPRLVDRRADRRRRPDHRGHRIRRSQPPPPLRPSRVASMTPAHAATRLSIWSMADEAPSTMPISSTFWRASAES